MNTKQIKKCIGTGNWNEAENVWMAGLADNPAPEAITEILAAFCDAGKADTAETLGWSLLDAHGDAPKEQQLSLAKAALLGAPDSEELRNQTAQLYKEVHGDAENFEVLYKLAGLETGQSPRRAIRTLDDSLRLAPGTYMASRFEDRVIRITGFNDAFEEFEFQEGSDEQRLEPKLLTDEFEILPPEDFRVLLREHPDDVKEMFQKDVPGVILGLCLSFGGEVDTDRLKDFVVGKYLKSSEWSKWWGRVRNAIKKNANLTLEGRNPAILTYHEGGLTLEDELRKDLDAAKTPEAHFALLKTYLGEANRRGAELDETFLQKIVDGLTDDIHRFSKRSPADAFEAALMLRLCKQLGAPEPTEPAAPAVDLLAKCSKPVAAIRRLPLELWPEALHVVRMREDAAELFEQLFLVAPAEQLDEIAAELTVREKREVVDQTVAQAQIESLKYVEILIWVWGNPKVKPAEAPTKLNLLSKLLDTLFEVDTHWQADNDAKREMRQRLRNALSASSYASYKQAIAEMDDAIAAVIRTKIDRTDGLAQAVHDEMIQLLRETHWEAFREVKVKPWENDKFLWTTETGLVGREEELKELEDVTMPANAKQIGEAAEQGDLRENADWQAAIEERDMLVAMARKIKNELAKARIITPGDVPEDEVGIGSTVTLKRLSDEHTVEVTILGPWDSNPDEGIYAYGTRMAQTLLGKELRQVVPLKFEGDDEEYRIESLRTADQVK
jgi:transcription elongation GreA/GreB family factor